MLQPIENSLEWLCWVQEGIILGSTNISSIVHFCLSKYSFSLNTFWTHLLNPNLKTNQKQKKERKTSVLIIKCSPPPLQPGIFRRVLFTPYQLCDTSCLVLSKSMKMKTRIRQFLLTRLRLNNPKIHICCSSFVARLLLFFYFKQTFKPILSRSEWRFYFQKSSKQKRNINYLCGKKYQF